jgi:hypothetical protein
MRAMLSLELNNPLTDRFPEMETLPGIVTDPDPSIVSRATPPVTIDMLSDEGLIIPVFGSFANLRAQLVNERRILFCQCRR